MQISPRQVSEKGARLVLGTGKGAKGQKVKLNLRKNFPGRWQSPGKAAHPIPSPPGCVPVSLSRGLFWVIPTTPFPPLGLSKKKKCDFNHHHHLIKTLETDP